MFHSLIVLRMLLHGPLHSESEHTSSANEVVLDKESERRLVNAVAQAVREGKVSPTSETSSPELSEEEIVALTDVIDQYEDKRVSERMSGDEKPATETTQDRQKRMKETIDEATKYGRQGLSQLLRIRYEAEREAKKKAE
jgi:hypothetical protein